MGKDKCQQTLLKWGPRCVISKAKSAKGKVFLAVTLPGGTLVFTNLTFMMGACLEHPECALDKGPSFPLTLLSCERFAGLKRQGGARPKEQSQMKTTIVRVGALTDSP